MNRKRVLGLDVIRAVAAILVVLYHYTTRYCEHDLFNKLQVNWPFKVQWGCLAIVTFFLLSGYLSYKDTQGSNRLTTYLFKKFTRLYPLLWIAIIITTLIEWLAYPDALLTSKEIILNFTGVPGLWGVRYVDGAYWTLQYEFIFIFWVAVAITINQYTKKNVMDVMLLCGVLLSFVIYVTQEIGLLNNFGFIVKTGMMSEYIGIFAIGYFINKLPFGISVKHYSIHHIMKIVLSLFSCFIWLSSERFVFLLVSIVAIIFVLSRNECYINTDNMFTKACGWIASISYPLYLCHQNIGYIMLDRLNVGGAIGDNYFYSCFCFCGAILLDVSIYRKTNCIFCRKEEKSWIR